MKGVFAARIVTSHYGTPMWHHSVQADRSQLTSGIVPTLSLADAGFNTGVGDGSESEPPQIGLCTSSKKLSSVLALHACVVTGILIVFVIFIRQLRQTGSGSV